MMYWSDGWNSWSWFAMTISMVAFWGAVGLVVWLVVRRPSTSSTGSFASNSSAEDVLRHRFAAGEIDQAEFEQRLHALRTVGTPKVAT